MSSNGQLWNWAACCSEPVYHGREGTAANGGVGGLRRFIGPRAPPLGAGLSALGVAGPAVIVTKPGGIVLRVLVPRPRFSGL
ncbi:MAG: hypothetical protein ACJ8AH_17055, partial [Stellaceae bacterium]